MDASLVGEIKNKTWVGKSLEEYLEERLCGDEMLEKLFVVNLATVEEKFRLWNELFPGIAPYYAVKCNPDHMLLQTLVALGACFDCASIQEMSAVLECSGSKSSDIVFANPCKSPMSLLFAKSRNIPETTLDNLSEIDKIAQYYKNVHSLIRIATLDGHSAVPLSTKFGASVDQAKELLRESKDKIVIEGIAFHCGSGTEDWGAFDKALKDSKELINYASQLGISMTKLDIGGGFSGKDDEGLRRLAEKIRNVIAKDFPGLRVCAEPGRFFAEETHILCVKIMHKECKITEDGSKLWCYTVTEGVYGCFKDRVLVPGTVFTPLVVKKSHQNAALLKSRIFGPSMHDLDVVCEDCLLPELQISDWLRFDSMGAYTVSIASNSDCHENARKEYIWI